MPNYFKIAGPLAELLSKLPAGSRAAQEAIAAEMAAKKAAQEAAYAPHTLPTEKGNKTIANAKKTLNPQDEARLEAELRAKGKEKFLEPSKVKQRLYHGTSKDITEFNPSKIGALGPGVYLSKHPSEASGYANITNRKGDLNPNVMPLYAQAENPFVISNVNNSHEELFKYFDPEGNLSDDEVIKRVLNAGYDSIYAKDSGELNMLNPRKIKSAIGNRGTYDIEDPDITKAHGGLVHMAEGGVPEKRDVSQLFPLKDEPKKPLTLLERDVYNTFGMLPDEDRLNILPRYKKDKGIIAPEIIYDLVKAIQSPRTSMHSELGLEDALNFALNTMGGSSVASAPQEALQMGMAKNALKSTAPANRLLTAADRAKVGKVASEAATNQPVTKLSEALGNMGAEGKKLRITQSDRTGAKYLGGPFFSAMQHTDPRYKEAMATWGVKTPSAASTIANQSGEDIIWSTLVGSPTQHRSNELIFNKLYKEFQKAAKQGNLSDELHAKFNNVLKPLFGEGADILDPSLRKQIDTFEKRAIVGNLLLGEGLGGGLRGGSIIPGKQIMAETMEPMLREAETFSIGPRLFQLNKGVISRPDLHPAFPEILQGKDSGELFRPVTNEIALPTFNEEFRARTGRKKPGYYDLTMTPEGHPYPTQDITEKYLTHLQKEGHADGGAIDLDELVHDAIKMAQGGSVEEEPDDDKPVSLDHMMLSAIHKMANGGSVYDTEPDMSDGGQFIQGEAF